MAQEVCIPRLGWSMEEGTFLGWLKQDGERVDEGDLLFELEGEKACQEVEAVDAGILRIPPDAPQPGAVVAVGTLLGYITAEDEPPPWLSAGRPAETDAASLSEPAAATAAPEEPTSETVPPAEPRPVTTPPAAPSTRRLARELGVPIEQLTGSGPAGRISENDIRVAATPAEPLDRNGPARATDVHSTTASPRARRAAAEAGVEWTRIAGTGRDGRVREADVRRAVEDSAGTAHSAATETPLSSRRRAIAERMLNSVQRTAPVTLTSRADATNLVALRQQFKAQPDATLVPAYTDIIACLTASVLKQHRRLAARWSDDGERLCMPSDDAMDIGIAVDTPDGLLVPVIRNMASLSLPQVVERSRTLIDRARSGKLTAAEMGGGAFTITNLGSFGIEAFSPILNFPETAILGLGAIRREAVVLPDDRIAPRDMLVLSLTFDHRAIDGAPAAAFLRDVILALEYPAARLLTP